MEEEKKKKEEQEEEEKEVRDKEEEKENADKEKEVQEQEKGDEGLAAVCCLSIALIVSVFFFFDVQRETNNSEIQRSLKSSQESSHVVSRRVKEDACPKFIAEELAWDERSKMKPIWAPGYPGSGSELLIQLISETMGQTASDIYGNECQDNVVSCKTHYPLFSQFPPVDLQDRFHSKFILLIRNPAKAFPSHFNWSWELHHGIQFHTTQAPQGEWRKYRDENFMRELSEWKRLIEWWMSGPYEYELLVPYEKLTSNHTGPTLLYQVTQTLHELNNLPVAENTECLWHKVVEGGKKHRKNHSYQPAYTQEQKKVMLEMLEDLSVQFRDDTPRSANGWTDIMTRLQKTCR